MIANCTYCGNAFDLPNKEYNRKVRQGNTKFFCTQSHATSFGNQTRALPFKEIETKSCARPGCSNTFEVTRHKKSQVKQYCSRSCATKVRY